MKRQSIKAARRAAEARPVRDSLKEEVRRCERCLRQREPHLLACHEIANGIYRQDCLDKRFGLLVVCLEPNFRKQEDCHRDVQEWPEPKQLALLYLVRQRDYDLCAYLKMTRPSAPNRITQDEVDVYIEELKEVVHIRRGIAW